MTSFSPVRVCLEAFTPQYFLRNSAGRTPRQGIGKRGQIRHVHGNVGLLENHPRHVSKQAFNRGQRLVRVQTSIKYLRGQATPIEVVSAFSEVSISGRAGVKKV